MITKTKGIEEFVDKAIRDSEFRQRLEIEPEEVFAEFDLTTEERKAISRMHKRLKMEAMESGDIDTLQSIMPLVVWA